MHNVKNCSVLFIIMLFARLYARVDILLTCQAASFHWERKFELMRLIQSRNILLTCQEIERSCICVLHARYRFCFSLQCFYWIKGNVPTVWYLCSDSVVFVFRQCGICVPTVWYLCSDSVVSVFGFHFISGKILFLAAAQKTLHIVYNHTLSSTDRHAYTSFVFLLKYYWYHAPTISFPFPYLLPFVGYLNGKYKA
jgi:hypothetical protein